MKFHIFASKDSNLKPHSKNLKKFEAEGEGLYGAYVEELNEQGYEINDVWVETDEAITTNVQNPRRKLQGRRGGYLPRNY